MANYVVGITGGIGSGKSAASDAFARHGITVVDADLVAREVVEPGTPGLTQILEHFGNSIIGVDGKLDRRALRALIFKNPRMKTELETILHPLIRAEVQRQLQAAAGPYVIYSAPLLIETKGHLQVNRVLVVDVPEPVQRARASNRDQQTVAQVQSIIDSQIDRKSRLEHADDIIDNQGDLAALEQQVNKLHQQYLALSQTDAP